MNPIDWKRLRPVSVFLAVAGILLGMFGIWFDTQVHFKGFGKLLTVLSLASIAAAIAALWSSCSQPRKRTITLAGIAILLLVLPLLALLLAIRGFGPPT